MALALPSPDTFTIKVVIFLVLPRVQNTVTTAHFPMRGELSIVATPQIGRHTTTTDREEEEIN